MATDMLVRNLRDGQLIVRDGATGTPQAMTLVLDEGDLQWTETDNTIEVLDRGSINSNAHTRPGDDASVQLSFSTKMRHLIGHSVTGSGDGHQLYEMVNNRGSFYASTSRPGEQFTLEYQFDVTAPGGAAGTSERIIFAKVYKETLEIGEGDEANRISFSGRDFETKPTVSRF